MANFEINENGDFKIKRTNADRIRNMSDEELAEMLKEVLEERHEALKITCAECLSCYEEHCTHCILKMLQSESEE